MDIKKTGIVMARAWIIAGLVTGAAIGILSLIAWFFHFSDGKINVGTVIIQIGACLLGGFAAGKGMKEKKYLWGLLVGIVYGTVLLVISLGISGTEGFNVTSCITAILICAGSAMLGGMIS